MVAQLFRHNEHQERSDISISADIIGLHGKYAHEQQYQGAGAAAWCVGMARASAPNNG